MSNLIKNNLQEINKICDESGISYLAVFGSQGRNEASEESDVDLLVEFKETPGLIKFIHTKMQFGKVFSRKVDLVTKKGLSSYISPFITQNLQKIYG